MSLFDRIFAYWRSRGDRMVARDTFKLLNGYTPVWHSWGGEIYESELVRAAIDARARHISKLQITVQGTAKPSLQNKLRLGPNEWQTWGQFLYRLSTILDVQTTALIVPVIDKGGDTTGIYPVLPDKAELVEFRGDPWVRFQFRHGLTAAVELEKVGIMTRFQYRNDFFGEGNRALHPTMELTNLQRQGIEEGVKNSASFRFMATLSNFSNERDLANEA
ncbi:MAG: phage portal protein, partial [Oscillospiraceae bacterium]|nr:phage portal protein [Oscillospiraceae bacterium]